MPKGPLGMPKGLINVAHRLLFFTQILWQPLRTTNMIFCGSRFENSFLTSKASVTSLMFQSQQNSEFTISQSLRSDALIVCLFQKLSTNMKYEGTLKN